MYKPNRRECLQSVVAAMAATAVPGVAGVAPKPQANSEAGKIKVCLIWGVRNPHMLKLQKQIGVTHAIAGVPLRNVPRSGYLDAVAKVKKEYDDAGITIAGIESHPVGVENIKLGLPGRDEELENYVAALKALGEMGIPMVCYDFCAGIGWYRTNYDFPWRGECSSLSFNLEDSVKQGPTKWGHITADQMWSNIEYFQKAVIPAAEKANVQMALHPDDPPVPELRGIARIAISAANYRRILNIVPSRVNGVTLELSVFTLMGEDINALAAEWAKQKKIFFIHARNIRGDKNNFNETFQDDGQIDYGRVFQTLHDNGWHGPLRPDHDPILEGDQELSKDFGFGIHPGYAILGKICGVQYIKGILNSRHIPNV